MVPVFLKKISNLNGVIEISLIFIIDFLLFRTS